MPRFQQAALACQDTVLLQTAPGHAIRCAPTPYCDDFERERRRLVSQGYDSWFFIAADYAFGKNMVSESQRVLAAAGGKSLGAVYHPIGNADYSSFILQAQASGAKAIAFANAGDQLVNLMKQWNEFGMNTGKQKPVAELMFDTDVHAMGPKIAKGLTTLTAWYWALNDESRAFGERFWVCDWW